MESALPYKKVRFGSGQLSSFNQGDDVMRMILPLILAVAGVALVGCEQNKTSDESTMEDQPAVTAPEDTGTDMYTAPAEPEPAPVPAEPEPVPAPAEPEPVPAPAEPTEPAPTEPVPAPAPVEPAPAPAPAPAPSDVVPAPGDTEVPAPNTAPAPVNGDDNQNLSSSANISGTTNPVQGAQVAPATSSTSPDLNDGY